jgi:hypothetical protein
MTESRAICDRVPINALTHALVLVISGSTMNERVCQPADNCRFHHLRLNSQGFRPNVAAIAATAIAPGNVCSQGWAGSPISKNKVTGSRSIMTLANAKIVQLNLPGTATLISAPGPK